MKIKHLTQKALRKTSTLLLTAEMKLEPTPQEEIIALLKHADIPIPILLSTLDHLQTQLETLENANA